MRIAVVHTRQGEVFIFQVKGSKKDLSAIDGFSEYFGPEYGRDIEDIISMELAHIGSGDAVVISLKTSVSVGRGWNIDDWFPDPDDDE